MTRARRKPSLPPLVRYQVDSYCSPFGMMIGDNYTTLRAARMAAESRENAVPVLIRRLSDGRIVYRNKAAKEAGY